MITTVTGDGYHESITKKCNNSDTTAFMKISDIDGGLRAFYYFSFESQ